VGIPGWEIILSNSSVEVSRTETDPAGYYEFFGLVPGSYTITESPKTGWISKSLTQNKIDNFIL